MKSALILFIPVVLFSCTGNVNNHQKTTESPGVQHQAVASDDGFKKYTENITKAGVPHQPVVKPRIKKEDPLPIELTPTQTFSINSTRDTTITCKAGTKIKIPSYSLIVEETGEKVNGNVVLSVNEFYSNSDIFMAQLTTSSKGDMLESGGMVYLGAVSNNRSCTLQKGKEIKLSFPKKEDKPDMQIFYGTRENNTMDWSTNTSSGMINNATAIAVRPDPGEDEVLEIYEVEEIPYFKADSGNISDYLRYRIKYPPMSKEIGIQGKVYIEFTVKKTGKIANVKVRRGVSRDIDKEAERVIKQMPDWEPGRLNGKPVNVKMILPINFILSGSGTGNGSNSTLVNPNSKKLIEDKKTDSVNQEDINCYVLSTASLGWINCDRFIKTEEKTMLAVKDAGNQPIVGMIFHNYRSYLRSTQTANNHTFANIPKNEEVTVICCKKENGVNYFSMVKTNTSVGSIIPVYKKVTMDELKKEIENLNSTQNKSVSMLE
ncbi:MAG: energy transducer TonB [Flavobacteriales bacterium]